MHVQSQCRATLKKKDELKLPGRGATAKHVHQEGDRPKAWMQVVLLLALYTFSNLTAAALVSHPRGLARKKWNLESSIINNFRGALILF